MASDKLKRNESSIMVAIVNNHIQSVTHLSNFLESKGYRTVWAYTGEAAIKLCEKERPDILFLDAQMPGMSGFDVARSLPAQKILFMVADEDIGKKAAKFSNCIGVIRKPVDDGELDDFLRTAFKLKKPAFE